MERKNWERGAAFRGIKTNPKKKKTNTRGSTKEKTRGHLDHRVGEEGGRISRASDENNFTLEENKKTRRGAFRDLHRTGKKANHNRSSNERSLEIAVLTGTISTCEKQK